MHATKEEIETAKKRHESAVHTACKAFGVNSMSDETFDFVAPTVFDVNVILEMIWSPQHKKTVMGIEELRTERKLRFLELIMSMDTSSVQRKSSTVHELRAYSLLHSREYRVTMRFAEDSENKSLIKYICIELMSHLFGALMNDSMPLTIARDIFYNVSPRWLVDIGCDRQM